MVPYKMKKKLKLLFMLRLLVATLFLCLGLVAIEESLVLFTLIVAILFLSMLYVVWLVAGKHLYYLAGTQIVLDLILESILMYFTGGFDSVFSVLMVLTIFSAGIIMQPKHGLVAAFLGSILFVIMFISQQWQSPTDLVYAGYISYVKVSIFLLVGFLSAAFARQVSDMEQELRLRERLSYLGEMAAQLAHEIRNPLMSITGAVELIHRNAQNHLSDNDKKLMQTIQTESHRLSKLLTEVLDYTRDEKLDTQNTRIAQVLDDIFLSFSQNPKMNCGVQITKFYQRHDHKAEIDRDKMKQVFINIIENSMEAMPDGGTLTIASIQDNGMIKISFADTGRGMNREQQKKVFQPFYTEKTGGSGIGLALAQKITRYHGGRVTFDTQEKKGTTFHVFLPAA